jgi:crossover junction endodeoxyribonuclease RuvC
MTLVLGLDPGFASIGYAHVLLETSSENPVRMGVFETEKSSKKRHVLASDDNVRRAREIAVFLNELLTKGPHGPVRAICAETMSFPRSSSVAAKMAMSWGIISALSSLLDIPILQATPMELKLRVTGSKVADKEAVQRALETRYGKAKLDTLCEGLAGGKLEHPYDALGAVVACRDSELLRLARRMGATT